MNLRIDPWDPEYGSSVELEPDPGPPPGLDLTVEVAGVWEAIAPGPRSVRCCAFIDGVRRIDARLFAEADGSEAPALAGSWAVGCARSSRPPSVVAVRVGRELVVGGGISGGGLELTIGGQRLRYRPTSVAGLLPVDPVQGLQNAMRDGEAKLAQEMVEEGECDLVVCDGPLTYFAGGPALGMIKRQARPYLDNGRGALLGTLRPGERTPLFKLGEQRLERYSWYVRLAPRRRIDGAMAGIVRVEVAAGDGLEAAVRLADLSAAVLPAFAPAPGRDPRAPQNLYPIGALESVLRHRLGDAGLVHRALEVRLHAEVRDAA